MRGTIREVKKICYIISLHAVGSMLCVVIPISMSYNSNLFYIYHILIFMQLFLKFIVHKINSEMVKSGMVKLTERENTDVAVDWML
jgi:hypothetical protein